MTLPFTATSNKSSNSLWMECWLWGASELFGHVVQFVCLHSLVGLLLTPPTAPRSQAYSSSPAHVGC